MAWVDLAFDALVLAPIVIQAATHSRRQREAEARERRRLRALVIVDRLEREGRGLPYATLEELRALQEGLLP